MFDFFFQIHPYIISLILFCMKEALLTKRQKITVAHFDLFMSSSPIVIYN